MRTAAARPRLPSHHRHPRASPSEFSTEPNFDHADTRNRFIADFQNFALSTRAFKHPNYLKFNNKPVIYMFITRAIVGSGANISSAFAAARQAAINAGFGGIYLVADPMFWGNTDDHKLSLMNPSALSCFAPVDPSQGVPQGSTGRPMRSLYTSFAASGGRSTLWNRLWICSSTCAPSPAMGSIGPRSEASIWVARAPMAAAS